jgi:hypothetical protein
MCLVYKINEWTIIGSSFNKISEIFSEFIKWLKILKGFSYKKFKSLKILMKWLNNFDDWIFVFIFSNFGSYFRLLF